jgi:Leucine-rich repeat (LRR) protein
LFRLHELNLARNLLVSIGNTLTSNTHLERLNVSANPIGSFKELANVAKLPAALDIAFDDPNWGPCTLCRLENYQKLALSTLPHLSRLDTCAANKEWRHSAEASFMEKKLYYNMRVKTLKRSVASWISTARSGRDNWLLSINAQLAKIDFSLKAIDRELVEVENGIGINSDKKQQHLLSVKHNKLREAHKQIVADAIRAERRFVRLRKATIEQMDTRTRCIMAELESGGNVRMIERSLEEPYFLSAQAKLQDSLDCQSLHAKDAGITGVSARRVVELHNRHLLLRYQDAVENMHEEAENDNYDFGDGGTMLLGCAPENPGELERIAEDGIDNSSPEYQWFSNRLDVADSKRLRGHRATHGMQSALQSGRVLMAKVFCGTHEVYDLEDGMQANTSDLKGRHSSMHSAVFRSERSNSRKCLVCMLEPSFVLPECIVEFTYHHDIGCADDSAALARVDDDLRPVLRPLAFFLEQASSTWPRLLSSVTERCEGKRDRVRYLSDTDSFAHVQNLDVEQCDSVLQDALQQPPEELLARETVHVMSPEGISKASGCSRLAQLTYLNLHNNYIRKVEALDNLVELRQLILSFNRIARIQGLDGLRKLEVLDLSYNMIKRIEGLKGLTNLVRLDMSSNCLEHLEDVNVLQKDTPKLQSLNLRNNVLRENPTFEGVILRRLPELQELDEVPINKRDRDSAFESSSMLSLDMVKQHARMKASPFLSTAPEKQQPSQEERSEHPSGATGDDSWLERAEHLMLEHKHIKALLNLSPLKNLRRASFNCNELSCTDGLGECKRMEHLSLENNRISSLDGIKSLTRLQKLDVGSNCIDRCEPLYGLKRLTQLSIEHNNIESLSGLDGLTALMELYMSSNKVAYLREVKKLKPLKKLMIFDLSSNPLCDYDEYRPYVLYTLSSLKVLDGSFVHTTEQAAARDTYTGRLTRELLEECTGLEDLAGKRSLDLSSLGVKELSNTLTNTDELTSIEYLKIEDNLLPDASGVRNLPLLQVLLLNYNRIENGALFESRCHRDEDECKGRDIQGKSSLSDCSQALEVLQLGGNCIESISSLRLERCSNLKVLFLHENRISRIDGLDKLVNLEELVLDRNRIKHLESSALNNMSELQELRLDDNGLRSLAHIEVLTSLRSLSIASNCLAELSELERLSSLRSLVELNAFGNALCKKPNYRTMALVHCPTLQVIDGEEVIAAERQNAATMVDAMEHVNGAQQQHTTVAGSATVQQPTSISSVPVKMTHMSFDQLIAQGESASGGVNVLPS